MVKRKHSNLLLIILGLVSITIIVNALYRPTQCAEVELAELSTCKLVNRLHNNDVRWDVTHFGSIPNLSYTAGRAVNSNRNTTPFLLAALNDADRFVVAHVVLTFNFEQYHIGGVADWNGLKVRFHMDGRVIYEGNDLDELYSYWEKKLSKE